MRVLRLFLGLFAASWSSLEALAVEGDVGWFRVPEREVWSAQDPLSVCALDAFHFGVRFFAAKRFLYNENDVFTWQLIAEKVEGYEHGAVVAVGGLGVTLVGDAETEEREETAAESEEGLQCEFDPEFCTPKLVNIRLPDVIENNEDASSLQRDHTMELEFEQPTNRPDASTKEQIDGFVSFTEYIGDELRGTWSDDGRVLVIEIKEIDESKVQPVRELMQGLLRTSIIVAGGGKERDEGTEIALLEGIQNLRIELPGEYKLRVLTSSEVVVWSPEVSIKPCDPSYLVVDPRRGRLLDTSLADNIISDTTPSFQIDGVLSHGGDEGFVVPHDSIQMKTVGSWSLSFWVFLTEDSTDSFRTLFFNGDGERQQRTPSAWWMPHQRRLVLRVSTNTSSDIGLDSSEELPLNKWVHMGFTFVNCSQNASAGGEPVHSTCPQSSSAGNWSYSYSFYVNGVVDTEVRINEHVVANNGPLHIGKGPWTPGMRGFTSSLKVYPVPVSSEVFCKQYLTNRDIHHNFDDCALSRKANFMAAAKQISFLSQCIKIKQIEAGDFDEFGGSSGPFSSFVDIQTAAFEKAVAAQGTCEPDAWDLLVEAADLGHPAACRDVGSAYLYGEYAGHDECPAPIRVDQNLTIAAKFLLKAFVFGCHSAGKPLALVLGVSNESQYEFAGSHLDLLTTGLLHYAASSGVKEAFAMLGRRYRQSVGLSTANLETAVYHYYHAAVEAADKFHQLGKQPLHEVTRLYDSLERDITVGEKGDDDELIQFKKMRADKEGDVEAMAAMGDLYYWGAHGVPRDHRQAYNYFNRAAAAGDVNSQSAVAGMLLKGEGTAQDNTTAIKWYEKAAEKNHTRALNGLGFIHFHGSGGVTENKSLALEYFERAAKNEEDGDSVFNAGYCHALGLGTKANISRAMEFYLVAARKFGHFDAIFELGKIMMNGVPGMISRDSVAALDYLKAASDGGQWGYTVRKGFDQFSDGNNERAAIFYHEGRELGYPVATSNLAFLYDQRLLQPGDLSSEQRGLKYLLLAFNENGDKETIVRIGDYHYYGLAGMRRNPKTAIRWYSRASAEGVDVGAYNVGHMNEFGDGVEMNLERAQRYYDRVLELSAESIEIQLAIRFAIARLVLRQWLQNSPLEVFLLLGNRATNSDTNMSTANSAALFTARTDFFYGKAYVLISTTVAICVTTAVWYLRKYRTAQ
ncbi:unnamed protein product [Phytophthora lilii]|uniref:Unnamed protein product n=1 Tax=Phytophthora lilii TaxID=2077276 RepID=A0A9W6WS71_9STRA|nr:unnamed protein product [Phytophthora lilii]